MSVRAVRRLLREIEAHGVSEVARAPGGFLYTYLKKGPSMLDETVPLGSITWRQKRAGFIARHLAQYTKNPTPRRLLALVAWAFDPPRSLTRATQRFHYGGAPPRFRWPDEVKREAFGLFLQGKTAALMFDEINRRARAITKDERISLPKNTVEKWIADWYYRVIRGNKSLPVPIFSNGNHQVVTEKDLAEWERAWHAGANHLQPPYNIITGHANPNYKRLEPTGASYASTASPDGLRDPEEARKKAARVLLGLANFTNPTQSEVASARRKGLLYYHPDKLLHKTPTEKQNVVKEKYNDMNKKLTDAANVFYPGQFFGSIRLFY